MAYMKDSTGRRLDSFAVASAAQVASGKLASRLGPINVNPFPAVTTDMPTVTWGTAATVSGRLENPLSQNLTILGRKGTWDAVNSVNAISADYSGRDFLMDGDTLKFSWREQTANATRIHVFVDSAPTSALPYVMNAGGIPATSAGVMQHTKLVFPGSKRRRITIYTANMYGWSAFRFPVTTSIPRYFLRVPKQCELDGCWPVRSGMTFAPSRP